LRDFCRTNDCRSPCFAPFALAPCQISCHFVMRVDRCDKCSFRARTWWIAGWPEASLTRGSTHPRPQRLSVSDDDFEASLQLNFFAALRAKRVAVSAMLDQGSGTIVHGVAATIAAATGSTAEAVREQAVAGMPTGRFTTPRRSRDARGTPSLTTNGQGHRLQLRRRRRSRQDDVTAPRQGSRVIRGPASTTASSRPSRSATFRTRGTW
jgi:hypothetical protein